MLAPNAVLAWLYPPGEDFAAAIRAGIDLGVSSVSGLTGNVECGTGAVGESGFLPPRLHLKLDTGLHAMAQQHWSRRPWPRTVRAYTIWTHVGGLERRTPSRSSSHPQS